MSGAVNTRVTSTSSYILQGSGKITCDGVDVGGYAGGVKVSWSQQEVFVRSDWQLGDVDAEITAVEVMISTELEETTLENLAIGYGLHSSSVLSGASSKVLTLDPPQSMREVNLKFEGMSATNRALTRAYNFTKCVRVGNSDTTLNRGVKTTVPVTFKALMASGSFGTVTDNTIA